MTALSHLPNLLSLLASVDQILSQTVSAAQPTSFAGLNSNKKYTLSPGLEIQQVIMSLWWGGMRLHGTHSPSWEVDAVHFQLHPMYFGNPGKRKRQWTFWMPGDWSHLCWVIWKACSSSSLPWISHHQQGEIITSDHLPDAPWALHSCCSQARTALRKLGHYNTQSEGLRWLHETAEVCGEGGTMEKQLFN